MHHRSVVSVGAFASPLHVPSESGPRERVPDLPRGSAGRTPQHASRRPRHAVTPRHIQSHRSFVRSHAVPAHISCARARLRAAMRALTYVHAHAVAKGRRWDLESTVTQRRGAGRASASAERAHCTLDDGAARKTANECSRPNVRAHSRACSMLARILTLCSRAHAARVARFAHMRARRPLHASPLIGSSRSAHTCLLYTSPSPRDQRGSRMPSSA